MSIFNVNPDPDYPVMDGPGFIQHTCQPYGNMMGGMQQQFYYNGQTAQPIMPSAPYGMPSQQLDSRRYDAQPTAMPQSTPSFGFNQLVETSRRNQGTPAQMQQPVSPWSGIQPNTQQIPQPVIPTQQQETYYPSAYDPRYSALYTCHPKVDTKQSAWGNQEVYSPVMPPTVNWGAQPTVVPQYVPQYGYMNSQPIQYPQSNMTQPIQQSWEEIAKNNFVR